ncbi:MAG: rod shape-determining protein [Clostridiales bacterium]|nr:rod shape-determining protein [Clostridiales bacterium]
MSVLVAMDLGTSCTSVYKQGFGLVLREPTIAAASKSGGEWYYGQDAKRLIGKTTESLSIIFSVCEGTVVDVEAASKLIRHFLSKVIKKSFFKQSVTLLLTVPCGLLPEERAYLEEAAFRAGIREVYLIEAPIASALGAGEHIDKDAPLFVADIGGGVTDIAAVSLEGIISGCSLNVGGGNIDTGIIDYLKEEHGLKVGLLSAEKIKVQIASLYPNDNTSMMINGRSVETGSPESMLLSSKNINPILEYFYGKILDAMEAVLNSLPPEVCAEVSERGAYLCGGASSVLGFDKFAYKRLQIPVKICDEPSYTTILGAGRILADRKLFEKYAGLR